MADRLLFWYSSDLGKILLTIKVSKYKIQILFQKKSWIPFWFKMMVVEYDNQAENLEDHTKRMIQWKNLLNCKDMLLSSNVGKVEILVFEILPKSDTATSLSEAISIHFVFSPLGKHSSRRIK